MPQGSSIAQLVTRYDPGQSPASQTSIDQALAQWTALSDAAQAEALLIVFDDDRDRPRICDRAAITQLAAARRTSGS